MPLLSRFPSIGLVVLIVLGLPDLRSVGAQPTPVEAKTMEPFRRARFVVEPAVFLPHSAERSFIGPGTFALENGELLMAAPWGRPPTNFEQLAATHPVPPFYRSRDGGRTWQKEGPLRLDWALPGMISDGRLPAIAFLAPAPGAVLRILPLGDSITRGTYLDRYESGPYAGQAIGLASPNAGGYRKPLQDRLRQAGIAFDFVGDLSYYAYGTNAGPDPAFDPDHQGLAGFSNRKILDGGVVPTPKDVLAALNQPSLSVPGIREVLARHRPDLILLMSGANGFDAEARDTLIRTIGEHSPALLLVATTTPQAAPRTGWEQVTSYNQSLPATVAARRAAGQRIAWVDLHAVLTPADLLPDGVHPTQAGLEKIAQAWFEAITAALRPSPVAP